MTLYVFEVWDPYQLKENQKVCIKMSSLNRTYYIIAPKAHFRPVVAFPLKIFVLSESYDDDGYDFTEHLGDTVKKTPR